MVFYYFVAKVERGYKIPLIINKEINLERDILIKFFNCMILLNYRITTQLVH